jgi:hypothetical protein
LLQTSPEVREVTTSRKKRLCEGPWFNLEYDNLCLMESAES